MNEGHFEGTGEFVRGTQLTARRSKTAMAIGTIITGNSALLERLLKEGRAKASALPRFEGHKQTIARKQAQGDQIEAGFKLGAHALLAWPGMYIGGLDYNTTDLLIVAENGQEVLSIRLTLNETGQLKMTWGFLDDDTPGVESATLAMLLRHVVLTVNEAKRLMGVTSNN